MFCCRRTRLRRIAALAVAVGLPIAAPLAGALGDKQKKQEKKQKKADQILASNYVPGAAWEAYFRDDKGRTYPVIQPVEQNEDKDWMGLTFTDYSGPKLRLAVMPVDNGPDYSVGEVPLGAIEELLTTSLFNTHRFELIERKAVANVLNEQDFGATDRVNPVTKAAIGKIHGADYLIFATVNEWSPNKSKIGGGGGKRGRYWHRRSPTALLKGSKSKAELAMTFRVVDSSTSATLFATTERTSATSWGVGLGGFGGSGFGGLAGYETGSPINYALVSCINKGAYQLAHWLKDQAWSGAVVMVDGQKVYLNAGSDKGIAPGMKLTVLAKGEELIDPTTGVSLGFATRIIGSLQVTAVNENHSIATIVQGCEGMKVGDIVELESTDYDAALGPASSEK